MTEREVCQMTLPCKSENGSLRDMTPDLPVVAFKAYEAPRVFQDHTGVPLVSGITPSLEYLHP